MSGIPNSDQILTTPDGKRYKVANQRKATYWDEVVMAAAEIAADHSVVFFSSTSDKGSISCNIGTNRRIPAGSVFQMEEIGIQVLGTYGNTLTAGADFRKLLENACLDFKVNKILVAEGPAVHFPPGTGICGQTNESNQSVLNNGAAMQRMVRGMVSPVTIDQNYELFPTLSWPHRRYDASATRPTISARCYIRFEVTGIEWQAATLAQ